VAVLVLKAFGVEGAGVMGGGIGGGVAGALGGGYIARQKKAT
jgi:hypothetical protein